MKQILWSICIGSFALALTAWGETKGKNTNEVTPTVRHKASTVQSATPTTARNVTTARPMTTERHFSRAPFRQRTYVATPRTDVSANARVHYNRTANARVRTQREGNFHATATEQARVRSNVTLNRERNIGANRNVTVRGGANATVTNNWRSGQFSGRQYTAFRNYQRQTHDRTWWRSHYSRIIFVSGGWWYWDAGYWYPAWGYDSYAYYPYDGPIYGYSNLAPDQVVSEVQSQLQRDGYYSGPIDGVLGPMTRRAIAAFQADHGLAITSTVDEPTLETLGIS